MPLIILGCTLEGKPAKELRGKMPRIYKAVLRRTAECWHDTILENHFTPGNDSRYKIENRNPVYLEDIKKAYGSGQGRYVSGIFKGQSIRWLRTFFQISGTSNQATIRMTAPTYWEHPFIGTFVDPKSGKTKSITRQPDKPGEVTQVNDADKAKLRKFARSEVQFLVNLRMQGL